MPSIYDTANTAVNSGVSALLPTVAPGAIANSMNTYMSPYITNVINDSVSRLRDRRNLDLVGVGDSAYAASAYGGDRHALLEGDLIDSYGRAEDELVARLLQQGFDTSSNLALSELGLMQAGGNSLVNAGTTAFNLGEAARTSQLQSGSMQQNLLQQILSQGSSQYENYINHPLQQLSSMLSAVQGNPLSGNVSQTYRPGLFDYLSLGAGVYAAGK